MSTRIVPDAEVEHAVMLVLQHQRKPVTYWQIAAEAGYFTGYQVVAAVKSLVDSGKVAQFGPGKQITATYALAGAPWAVAP